MINQSSAIHSLSQLSPFPPLSQTWHRLLHLDTLVELTASTLWQYNAMSFQYSSTLPVATHSVALVNSSSIRGDSAVALVTEGEFDKALVSGGESKSSLVSEGESESSAIHFCNYFSL